MAKVKISRGLQNNYNAIPNKDGDMIYVCTDSGNIYVGDTLVFEPNSYIDASINDKIVTFTTHGTHGTNGTDTLDLSMFQTGSEVAQAIAAALASIPEYTIERLAVAETGYSSSYILKKGNSQVGATINIPKDMVVSNGEVKTVTTANVPYQGAQVGDKYIDLTIANTSQNHIYIPVKDLVDVYFAGNGINISSNNYISVIVDQNNSNGLGVGGSGVSMYVVSPSINGVGGSNGAMLATDKEKLDGIEAAISQALSRKADKVANATNGNFAGLDSNGNLTDSGKKASDFEYNVFTAGSDTTPVVEGKDGLVPAPTFTEQSKFLRGDGTWQEALQPTDDVAYVGEVVGSSPTADFNAQSDTVWNKAQVLSSIQKAQARTNIDAQEALVSGTNIKTINNESLLGRGNITIQGGGGGGEANVIESISINGTTQTVTSKNVDLPVPTSADVYHIVNTSQSAYNALVTKDSHTLYLITS